ncbi:MAG: saccharopine dehydrogenase C-terminal domain-containing protein [Thermodesulfobacteriota bacterium]
MKLLILGAAGETCSPATRDIIERGAFSQVTLADLNIDKLRLMARALGVSRKNVLQVDAGDLNQVREVMLGHRIVINGLPKPFAYDILRAALQAKVSCCDLGSPDERILALDDKAKDLGLSYVAGMGASPGITNVMAKHAADRMDEVEEIHVSFAAFRPFALSPALLDTILWEFEPGLLTRTYYQDGQFHPVPPFAGERVIEFPLPIGARRVFFVPHGETRSFPRNLKAKRVFVRGTFTPKSMRLMRSLLDYGFYDTRPIKIKGLEISPKELIRQALPRMPEAAVREELYGFGIKVEVIGQASRKKVKRTYWSTHPSMSEWGVPFAYANNIGLPLGICAQLMAEGQVRPGVNTPEAMIEPEGFFDELAKRKIMVHYREEILSGASGRTEPD